MPGQLDSDVLRSEQVQDILSRVPSRFLRCGSAVLLVVLTIMLALAYCVRFPSIIDGHITLTTEQQPVRVVNKFPGKIEVLSTLENRAVKAGDRLALIESSVDVATIDQLRAVLRQTRALLRGDIDRLAASERFIMVGEFQLEYNNLLTKIKDYEFLHTSEFYKSKMQALHQQVQHYRKLQHIADTQLDLAERALKNAGMKYQSDKILADGNVISKNDFLQQENVYLQHQEAVEAAKKYAEEMRITELEYVKQLNDLTFELSQRMRESTQAIEQSVTTLESLVSGWKKNYEVTAPVDGTVYSVKEIARQQHVMANQELFVIVPKRQHYRGILTLSTQGFGKVKKGQRVRIRLDQYPYQEFGQLMGTVSYVPPMPLINTYNGENRYNIQVTLDAQNKTSFHRYIALKPEMGGTGEIITDNRSLLERLFSKMRGIADQ